MINSGGSPSFLLLKLDGPIDLGVFFGAQGEASEIVLAGGDAEIPSGDCDCSGGVIVVRDGDGEVFSADDFGDAGVDPGFCIPFHILEIDEALHDVAVGGNELRVVFDLVNGVGKSLVGLNGEFG